VVSCLDILFSAGHGWAGDVCVFRVEVFAVET